MHAAEQQRPDVQQARKLWKQQDFDPSKLVFVDETSAKTDMARLYGRCLKGQRLVDHAPKGHWKTMTFVAGLRHDSITAPWVLDSAMNAESFKAYLKTQLAPTLNKGDIVIMDNLPAHKVGGVKEIIEGQHAKLLYLPPYSPDLNPIEQVFAKLKALLRKAAKRSFDTLWKTIGKLLDLFPQHECENYFINSGYELN